MKRYITTDTLAGGVIVHESSTHPMLAPLKSRPRPFLKSRHQVPAHNQVARDAYFATGAVLVLAVILILQ